MTFDNPKYGTVDYYATHFSDFLADVDGEDPVNSDNILKGFYMALDEWFDYHANQVTAYSELREKVKAALDD